GTFRTAVRERVCGPGRDRRSGCPNATRAAWGGRRGPIDAVEQSGGVHLIPQGPASLEQAYRTRLAQELVVLPNRLAFRPGVRACACGTGRRVCHAWHLWRAAAGRSRPESASSRGGGALVVRRNARGINGARLPRCCLRLELDRVGAPVQAGDRAQSELSNRAPLARAQRARSPPAISGSAR